MTAAGGLAQNALQLGAARIGVGVGESAGQAPVFAMLADFFPKDRRSQAMAILTSGTYLGFFFGFMLGGWVEQYYGWRAAMFVAGGPGIVLALLLRFTVHEPVRGAAESSTRDLALPSVRELTHFLLTQRSYLLVLIGYVFLDFNVFSFAVWIPSVLRRVHHMGSAEVGIYAGFLKGGLGIVGCFAIGWLVDRYGKRDDRWKAVVPAIACAISVPMFFIFLFASSLSLALFALGVAALFTAGAFGPVYALFQSLVKVRMRSVATAVIWIVGNFFGLGLGPLIIGISNDALKSRFGPNAVLYSLIWPTLALVVATICFAVAARFVPADVERAEA
jgi:MFS family permease